MSVADNGENLAKYVLRTRIITWYNEVLDKRDDFLYPAIVKYMKKEPWYYETSSEKRTNFASPLVRRYIEIQLYKSITRTLSRRRTVMPLRTLGLRAVTSAISPSFKTFNLQLT